MSHREIHHRLTGENPMLDPETKALNLVQHERVYLDRDEETEEMVSSWLLHLKVYMGDTVSKMEDARLLTAEEVEQLREKSENIRRSLEEVDDV